MSRPSIPRNEDIALYSSSSVAAGSRIAFENVRLPRVPRRWSGPIARADRIHRFPAKMAIGLGEVFIQRVLPAVTQEGDLSGQTFYDPMCGSGTTALVARAFGLSAACSDLLPTSTIIAAAKLNRLPERNLLELVEFSESNHLTGNLSPIWLWPTALQWYPSRALRALQDIRVAIEAFRRFRQFPHLMTALSWTSWDASSADPAIMVPTHSRASPWNRAISPERVQERFRRRLQTIISAQGALGELDIDTGRVAVWNGSALDPATWRQRPRFILTSPPYGLGIDYVRAASLQWHILFPDIETAAVRPKTLGRSRRPRSLGRIARTGFDASILGPRFGEGKWWNVMQRDQPSRAQDFLVFLNELSTFLAVARNHVRPDGVFGIAIGDPETCWTRIPLTAIVRDLATGAGFRQAYPDLHSGLRRRFQATDRRSSAAAIKSETLLTFVPN